MTGSKFNLRNEERFASQSGTEALLTTDTDFSSRNEFTHWIRFATSTIHLVLTSGIERFFVGKYNTGKSMTTVPR